MAESYIVDNAANALTAATAKSVLVVTAGSSKPFRVIQMSVGCDATATGLLKAELLVGTLSGGTAGTAPSINRYNGESWNAAAQSTVATYTAEPTYTKATNNNALVVKTLIFPLPSSPYDIEFPLGREYYILSSNLFAIRLTSTTVSPNAYTNIIWEE